MPDFVVLHTSGEHDPNGLKLHGVLEAQMGFERARGVRGLAVAFVAAISLPVWLASVWPALMGEELRTLVRSAWFIGFVGLLMAAFSEWRWRHRLNAVTSRQPRI